MYIFLEVIYIDLINDSKIFLANLYSHTEYSPCLSVAVLKLSIKMQVGVIKQSRIFSPLYESSVGALWATWDQITGLPV